jgi:hypothetical protein
MSADKTIAGRATPHFGAKKMGRLTIGPQVGNLPHKHTPFVLPSRYRRLSAFIGG